MKRRIVFAALMLLLAPVAVVQGNTYIVNTSSDTVMAGACDTNASGCSLRGAIIAANGNAGSTIVFNINEFCPINGCAISLLAPLPDIIVSMTISGPTQFVIQRSASAASNFRIFNVSTPATVNFSNLTIAKGKLTGSNNNGAGIRKGGSGTLNVTNCTLRDNQTESNGGGIQLDSGTLTVTNTTFNGNGAEGSAFSGGGGGISQNGGTLTVTGCTFTNNFAGERGGAVFVGNAASGTPGAVSDSTFTGNNAHLGGAICTFSNLDVSRSTFAANSAGNNDNFLGSGGAFGVQNGTTNITNCTISGNSSENSGGGIYNHGTANLTNTTITSNSVARTNITPAGGGGAYTAPPDPSVPFDFGGTTNIKSSIVALNSVTSGPGPDVSGTFQSSGFNFIGKSDNSSGFTAATDRAGTIAAPFDPKLDPNGLQNNGGPTQTIALLPGSPAIDTGTSAGLTGNLTSDQRGTGFTRVLDDPSIGDANGGDGTDVGAFELQTAQPTHLANISTRLRVETGDNVLIGGFIITGTQPKKVILRAIGPSLPFGGKLENPVLELHGPNGLIEMNDNWISSPNRQAISDTNIAPPDDLESAIVQSLPANNTGYTAIVRGHNDGTGIGVVEAYDLDATVDSRLANISTRGLVQTGDNVLIAGTIVVGTSPQKVIIRALGPSVSVPGKMADPTLELRNQNGDLMEANDNWVESPNKQAIMDSGIPPSDDRESAIVETLVPSGYTAIVRGSNNSTGIAVVEVYALQ